jgi:hypothetical protein
MATDTEIMKKTCVEHTKQLATLEMSGKAMLDRLNKAEEVINIIHKLSVNVESQTEAIRDLGDKIEHGLREQGKRIGTSETLIVELASEASKIKEIGERVTTLEKKPGNEALERQKQTSNTVRNAIITGLISLLLGAGVTAFMFLSYYINA